MKAWTRETKHIFECLVLGGMTIEKRPMKTQIGYGYNEMRWYITLPLQNYVRGPYVSKTEAVMRAATLMELDICQILKTLPPQTSKSSRSASRSAASSSCAT